MLSMGRENPGSGRSEERAEQVKKQALRFTSSGFELYLPLTAVRSSFVMLDEGNEIFYSVDYDGPRAPNGPSREAIAPGRFADPAIAFPPEHTPKLGPHGRATGFLVSISSRVGGEMRARSYGQVTVKRLAPDVMYWEIFAYERASCCRPR
jgi:hypothetical protein